MFYKFKLFLLVLIVALGSCASLHTPSKFLEYLSKNTKNIMISERIMNRYVSEQQCQLIKASRYYIVPMKFSEKNDIKSAAIGIDDWLKIDGGNAFVLKNYNWRNVDIGAKQLEVIFDTYQCNIE